jgi:hypothetical protein
MIAGLKKILRPRPLNDRREKVPAPPSSVAFNMLLEIFCQEPFGAKL